MRWFKHYCSAWKSETVQALAVRFGKHKGYAFYFLLVEYFADKWDGDGPATFRVNAKELAKFLETNARVLPNILETLEKHSEFSAKTYSIDSQLFYEIEWPKLLKIKHRDSISSSHRPEKIWEKSGPIRKEKKRKEKIVKKKSEKFLGCIPELSSPRTSGILRDTTHDLQRSWLETYRDAAWIREEIAQADNWLTAKGETRKDLGLFFNNWLKRSWRNHKPVAADDPMELWRQTVEDLYGNRDKAPP